MKNNLCKFRFDIGMASLFVLLLNPGVTGLAFHELASVVFGVAIIIHVVLNWNWVIRVSKKIFSKSVPRKTRLSYGLNIVLVLNMFVLMMSGLLISEVLLPNFRYFKNVNWLPIHIVSSFIGLLIIGIHLGLHWNWIKQMGTKFPSIQKLFSFRKPSRKTIINVLLTIGTIAILVQVPKQVILTQAIFSEQTFLQENKEGHEQRFMDRENELGREHGELKKSERREEGYDNVFSVVRLLGLFPILIIYSAILGTIAFYTQLMEKRVLNKWKETS